jgi:hypothetical protein
MKDKIVKWHKNRSDREIMLLSFMTGLAIALILILTGVWK